METMQENFSNNQEFWEKFDQNGLKKLEVFSQFFLTDAFQTIFDNIECFSVYDFHDKTLFHTLESFVCEARKQAEKHIGCQKHFQTKNGTLEVSFSEEPLLRAVFNNTINGFVETKVPEIDEELVPRLLLTGKVCKKMCASACTAIFESERQDIIEANNALASEKKLNSTPSRYDKDEQEKVVEIFNEISKSNIKVPDLGVSEGYNPRFRENETELKLC